MEGLPDLEVQRHINQRIQDIVTEMTTDPENLHPAYEPGTTEITFTYSVGVNKNSVLSLRFGVYSFPEHAANGRTVVKSMTVNLENGRVYPFKALFKPDSDYIARINAIIKGQFEEREIPQIEPFETISEDQGYYLTANDLVIYFQELEYTPHYVGVPEFLIPYAALANIISPWGPIARLYEAQRPMIPQAAEKKINIRYR